MSKPVPLIEDVPWTELTCFKFNIFPDELLVMTNATRADFDKAVAFIGKAHEEGNDMNIESALWHLGFVACVCSKPNKMEEITF